MTRLLRLGAIACGVLLPAAAAAQETVRVTVPGGATLNVANVTATTTAAPVRVSFDTLLVIPGRRLKISVRADSATFTRPGTTGLSIAATKVSWTTSSASGGTGSSGTLNATSYTAMFVGSGSLSGGVDVSWQLDAPGGGIRSGSHTLVVRYKVEAE